MANTRHIRLDRLPEFIFYAINLRRRWQDKRSPFSAAQAGWPPARRRASAGVTAMSRQPHERRQNKSGEMAARPRNRGMPTLPR